MGRRIRYFVLISLLVATAVSAGWAQSQEDNGIIEDLKLFSKALGAISEAWVGDVTPRNLLYQAVKGMLGSLDKFSEFIEPERFKLLQIHMRGEYAGIGAILQIVNNQVGIRAVEPGKPADKAGLRPGDIILKIDGISMENKSVMDVSSLLRGEANTPVTLTVLREPRQIFDVKIERAKIEIQAVQDSRMIGKELAYLRLAEWQEHTASQTDTVLEGFKKQGMKALIIDLRNNDGGLLTQAVALAERFLPKGKKIVSVQSKIPEQRKEYFVTQSPAYPKLTMVILVNEKSASASEVFSAAMQEHRRATLVGVKTYGKGSVQSVIPLDDVSAMKLTTARYATPSGKVIDMIGLIPDRVVSNGTEGTPGSDRQILEAIAILKQYM
ncbi:MAG TPA: S41 family peptidase [Candidatus Omnitrophota bacterium]|nr:S41 family peptidase [Candidatus Omnitrophota bacterium]HPS37305.1 S41 family peptidase [Candidatus Omnitrophota bacterium]